MGLLPFEHDFGSLDIDVNVGKNQLNVKHFMDKNNLDAIYITSQDEYLSEYCVARNNHRYLLTGFNGSAGDLLVIKESNQSLQFILFVDGRYHIQAEAQAKPHGVVLQKLPLGASIEIEMQNTLVRHIKETANLNFKIGLDFQRLSWNRTRRLFDAIQSLASSNSFVSLNSHDWAATLGAAGWACKRDIVTLDVNLTGRSLNDHLALFKQELDGRGLDFERSALLLTASDDASWFLNARAYHLPRQSSLLCYLFICGRKIFLYLLPGMHECGVDIPAFQADPQHAPTELVVCRGNLDHFLNTIRLLPIDNLLFSGKSTNAFLPNLCKSLWPFSNVYDDFFLIERSRAVKTQNEIFSIKSSFLKSSRAISSTIQWAKQACQSAIDTHELPSEHDLAEKIKSFYGDQGALELSFQTIAGVGQNGAIIHYSEASRNQKLMPGEICLLDSGAYYESGFATDCTRTFFLPSKEGSVIPQNWQKEVYSVVLKACIAGMRAQFSEGTIGKEIDAIVRNVVQKYGYDYAHGTGHGVGIHVHEDGIRLSPASDLPIIEHGVVSIEPGIYLPGKGGVRIENVVVVKRDANSHNLYFENIVFVDYDWSLIDLTYFTEDELMYLNHYSELCKTALK